MDADRRARLVRLLTHRHDHLPGQARRVEYASVGFVHDTYAPTVCPVCDGVDDRCTGCRGRGFVEVRRRRDPYARDQVARYGLTGDRHEDNRARDRIIDRLDRQIAPPRAEADLLAEANARDHAWLQAREPLRQLDRALDSIRRCCEPVWLALHRLQVGEPLFEAGLLALDRLLPATIVLPDPPATVARAGETRDQRIVRQVLADHVPTAEVAVAEGLSVRQVNRIVQIHLERSDAA